MEQKKIHGSTHDDNNNNDRSLSIEDIPLDLMAEILSRLPGKLIGRSRSVSKRYDSVHGLVYLETSTQLMIWNPTMKHFFTLPEPEGSEGKYITGSLGCDPIDCKYKALCHLTGDKIGILTLGSQESWRILSQGFPSHSRRMSEKFHLINYLSRDGCFFVSYEGRLALMVSSNGHSAFFTHSSIMAAITVVSDLKPLKSMWKIRVKIIHLWKKYSAAGGVTIEMVLIDSNGVKINASVKNDLVNQFDSFLSQGSSKILINFSLNPSFVNYKDIRDGTLNTDYSVGELQQLEELGPGEIYSYQNPMMEFTLVNTDLTHIKCVAYGKEAATVSEYYCTSHA
ncbi:hypothetical protein DY000_02003121 [Brassica cretica]|uniref:F-box domain-containing protein n=1 Tax=Brassica cretica TaxID=69181 RepID=A0ABQ7C1P6_BRACR|nr:hypothetical protein DY000_02003121 [Brassica cretica]